MKQKLWLFGLLVTIALFISLEAQPATALANLSCPNAEPLVGTVNITCSYARDAGAGEAGQGATFWAGSSAFSANTTFINVSSNATVNGTCPVNATTNNTCYLGFSYNSAIFQDANDTRYFMQIFNQTAGQNVNSSAVTGILIDNTVPQAPSALSPAAGYFTKNNTLNITSTVTGANTTACTLAFSGYAISTGMTHTGNTCVLSTVETNLPARCYDYTITASDGTNTSASASPQFCVQTDSVLGGASPEQLGLGQTQGGAAPAKEGIKTQWNNLSTGGKFVVAGVIVVILNMLGFLGKEKWF